MTAAAAASLGRGTLQHPPRVEGAAPASPLHRCRRLAAVVTLCVCCFQTSFAFGHVEGPQQPAVDPLLEPGVREALQRYTAALESLDADAVKKVQPSIDVNGLRRAFGEMRSLDVEIDEIRVLSADRATARVSCRVTQTLTPRAGSRQKSTVTRVLRLRRQDSGWIIQDFER